MIRSNEHAMAVQTRRFNAGKKGVAKAVRSFNKRRGGEGSFTLNAMYPANFKGCKGFEETMRERYEMD